MKYLKKGVMKIEAKPEVVFPLLCPVRESEWIDGWSYELIHSESGLAEAGCVFKTNREPENEAYWIMTRHEPPHEAEFVRFVTGKMFVALNFNLIETKDGTDMAVTYSFTGVTQEGNRFIEITVPNYMETAFNHLEAALNYFVRTGSRLQMKRNQENGDIESPAQGWNEK